MTPRYPFDCGPARIDSPGSFEVGGPLDREALTATERMVLRAFRAIAESEDFRLRVELEVSGRPAPEPGPVPLAPGTGRVRLTLSNWPEVLT